jgi:alpha-1,6-mannosyltransferase
MATSSALRTLRIVAGTLALAVIVVISWRIASSAATDASPFLGPTGNKASYPGWLHGPLAGHGSWLTLDDFLVLLGALSAAYVVAVLCATALPVKLLLGAAVASIVVFTLAPPILSKDFFNYIAYGRLWDHGINPYAHGPGLIPNDPIYPYVGHMWDHLTSPYGPLFTLLTSVVGPLGAPASVWVLKGITGAAGLGCLALLMTTARRLERPPALAVAIFGLNPLLLVYAVGGAHNDLLMAFLLILGLSLALRERLFWAGAVLVAAVGVKLSAALVLPFFLLGVRPRQPAMAGVAAAGAALVTITLAVFGTASKSLLSAAFQDQQFHWIVTSVPGFLWYQAGLGHVTPLMRTVLLSTFAVIALVLVVRSIRGREWLENATGATLAMLVTTLWVLPWYIVWLLSPAALLRRRVLPAAAVALTLMLVWMQTDHFLATRKSHRHHLHAGLAVKHR